MQDKITQAVAALQTAKQKGLSYYEAVQSLKARGFSQDIIDDASDQFNYKQEDHVSEMQKLDEEHEQIEEDEREDRVNREMGNLDFHF
jgi:hypothetical protein